MSAASCPLRFRVRACHSTHRQAVYGTLEGDPTYHFHLAGSPNNQNRFYGHSLTPRSRYYNMPRTTFSRSLGPSSDRSYYMGSGHVSTAAHAILAPPSPMGSGTFRRSFDGSRTSSVVHHGAVHY
mmetsp:Transcript_106728/g.329731  ORF Transcript_106728/g.329731 Transcript_106728/m.329731 type:complete len:125 (+) Transcript_106728:26-400(+)